MKVSDAAAFLMLSQDHVRDLVKAGEIAAVKIQQGRRLVYLLDDESVREWKRSRPNRPEKRGAAWRKGLLLTRRQWRCNECGTICQKDMHKNCRNCGRDRRSMLITRHQWRCSQCGCVCENDLHTHCVKCGVERKGK